MPDHVALLGRTCESNDFHLQELFCSLTNVLLTIFNPHCFRMPWVEHKNADVAGFVYYVKDISSELSVASLT